MTDSASRGRALGFRHEVIDPDPPGAHHDIVLLGDLTGDGRTDVVIGSKEGDVHLWWYENPTWERHEIATAPQLEAGGVLHDLTGDGHPDIIAGQQIRGRCLWWFERPADPRGRWPVRLITDRFEKYHDQAVGDVDGDGEAELVFLSQKSRILACYDVPDDPRIEPWPDACLHVIAEEFDGEGLRIIDIDGDGATEILAGTSIFKRLPDGRWSQRDIAPDFVQTRVVAADFDGDGRLEIVLAEGESDRGRLAWLRPPDWRPTVLRDGLFHPHSLEVADFDGDGRPDFFIGEMGLGRCPHPPRLLVYRNCGSGLGEAVISEGIPTHEAKTADLTGDGRPDIVGKPYLPKGQIDLWLNET